MHLPTQSCVGKQEKENIYRISRRKSSFSSFFLLKFGIAIDLKFDTQFNTVYIYFTNATRRIVKFPSSVVSYHDNSGISQCLKVRASFIYERSFGSPAVTSPRGAFSGEAWIHNAPAFSVAHSLPLQLHAFAAATRKKRPPPGEEMHASRNAAPTTAQGEPLLARCTLHIPLLSPRFTILTAPLRPVTLSVHGCSRGEREIARFPFPPSCTSACSLSSVK